VLEHLAPEALENFIREMHRVCFSDAIIKVTVPIGRNWQKWPEHRIPFDETSDEYFMTYNKNGKPIFEVKNKEVIKTDDGLGDLLMFELEVKK